MTKDIYFGWRDGPIVTRIHDTSVNVKSLMEVRGVHGEIATLSPVRVLDSGLSTYKEFASGPFFFRSSDRLSSDFVRSEGWVSKETLTDFLDKNRPAAILTGFEDSWLHPPDAVLEAYAKARGFEEISERFDGGRLFVRRD